MSGTTASLSARVCVRNEARLSQPKKQIVPAVNVTEFRYCPTTGIASDSPVVGELAIDPQNPTCHRNCAPVGIAAGGGVCVIRKPVGPQLVWTVTKATQRWVLRNERAQELSGLLVGAVQQRADHAAGQQNFVDVPHEPIELGVADG